jgi:hypothetical protein
MKFFLSLICSISIFTTFAAIPTEEGLLKNLNNPSPMPGQTIVKFKVTSAEEGKPEAFYKVTLTNENPNTIQVLQQKFNGVQMNNTQLKDVKYEADLVSKIRREKASEKTLFYSSLMFLVFNKGTGIESLIEKNGGAVTKTRTMYNEEKLRLLRNYKVFLASGKSKSEADSPLNPQDPKEKQRVQDLFRSNSLRPSPNVQLTKLGSEFLWTADWKSVVGYFSNEERRLRILDLQATDAAAKVEFDQYGILNGVNEFPKTMAVVTKDGAIYRIQILGVESRGNKEKPILSKVEELKKIFPDASAREETDSFLF